MPFLILSRAVHFGSCLVLLSIFAVRLLIEPRAAGDERNPRRLAGLCLLVAAVSGTGWLWAAIAGMNGSGLLEALSPQLIQMVLGQTTPGHVWIVRFAIGALLALLLGFPHRRWTWIAGAALSAALAGSLAWLGHAGAGGDAQRPFMLAGDVAHLVAAGVWPAGLLPFALLLHRQMKAGALAAARTAARRFSAMSVATVAVLAASGACNTFFLVGSFHALAATDYGRLLLTKVALFVGAACLGARNLLVHKPRLEIVPEALEAMVRAIWIEIVLGILIVLIVAILGTMAPAYYP